MRLYQYWDSGEPPDEVAGWMEEFRASNPGMTHELHHRDSASWFIGKRIGARERAAFDSLAVPAMQADYFRLCAVCARGGVWIDADYQPSTAPLSDLVASIPGNLLQLWHGHLVTGVIVSRQPGDAFLRAALDLATLNIEARIPERAYIATGPGALNAVRALIDPACLQDVTTQFENIRNFVGDFAGLMERAYARIPVTPELERAFHAMSLMEVTSMKRWIRWRSKPSYKQTGRHWQNWEGSQYLEPEPAAD